MATLAEILNKVTCGLNVLGTGTDNSCQPVLKAASSLWFTKRGFEFDKSKTFDETYITTLQKEKKLIILKGVVELTVNKEENPTETDELGIIRVLRDGKYSFSAKFMQGFEYVKALYTLNSFGAFDCSIVDNEGNILGTESKNGSLRGFTLGMLNSNGVVLANNTATISQGLSFQFLYTDEIEYKNVFISKTELNGYRPQEQDGVHQVEISITTPANLATTIVFDAKLKNGKVGLSGLILDNLLVTENGAEITPSAIAESATVVGRYTLTVPALATNDVVNISLYDNSSNTSAIYIEGVVFQSNTVSATVIA